MRKPEIAISLSGGGYRAAMYHLGSLMYLHSLRLNSDECFLDYVNTISTISGGSITGLWYMMNYAKGNISEKTFEELFNRICKEDLIGVAADNLLSSGRDSLILEMVDSYDRVFFNNETFDLILDCVGKDHIHHFSANGTDFDSGLGFRFQAAARQKGDSRKKATAVIGNDKHKIPAEYARKIKLSEIMAVSSCFTGGFEALNFPSDFDFYRKAQNKEELLKELGEYQLMDGGVVDNQGIEPLILANNQMINEEGKPNTDKLYACHDLMIISDVSHPDVEGKHKVEVKKFPNLTMRKIERILWSSTLVGAALSAGVGILGCKVALGVSATITAIMAGMSIASLFGKKAIARKIKEVAPVEVSMEHLWSYPLKSVLNLIGNRALAFYHMGDSIFMKSIRQLRYSAVYENPVWHNRMITNAVYELSSESTRWKSKIKSGQMPEYLTPTDVMQKTSRTAAEMGTTLWFTDEHWDRKVPQSLCAAGQYNICMNLLEYIHKLKADPSNTNESHRLIMQYEDKLREDWERFQKDPFWMVPLVRTDK